MDRNTFVAQIDAQLKLVRTEFELTQEKMALILGISKKTLVEIEKGRSSLGWSGAVTLCTLFADSRVLQNAYGGELSDMLRALAFQDLDRTMYEILKSTLAYLKQKGGVIDPATVEAYQCFEQQMKEEEK